MNIVYSSDENYIQHLAVSIYSLLKNNEHVPNINIFILSNEIAEISKEKIRQIVTSKFNRTISFVDFDPYKQNLKLNMEWEISLSSYARLFLCEMLPHNTEKVIYIDCDTVIMGSLLELWDMDMQNYSVAGVIDTVLPEFKKAIGLTEIDFYINAGILLIDLNKWRNDNIQMKFMSFIAEKSGRVSHHDQGTINAVLHNDILPIHPKYNSMTPFFTTNYKNLLEIYNIKGEYYTETQIAEAKKNPIIIHYVPEFVGRVWEKGCIHPRKKFYKKYLNLTDFKGHFLPNSNKLDFKKRIIYLINCKAPIWLKNFFFNR
ncbi:MAG: glycosyltransferase family 8 protein [Clostridia bacterium]|nr:glycosyltransferase family 8 protein [Clostridia bacterium]